MRKIFILLIANLLCFTACNESVDKINDSNETSPSQIKTSISSSSSQSSKSTILSTSLAKSSSNTPTVSSKGNTEIKI